MFDQIISVICEGEKLTFQQLLAENRKEEIVYARQLIMYFAKTKKVGSLAFIGSRFGKDHSTVIHAIKTIQNYIDTDRERRNKILDYGEKLNAIKRIIDVKAELHKNIDPFKEEISKLEQRLIFLRLTVDNLIKEIDTV